MHPLTLLCPSEGELHQLRFGADQNNHRALLPILRGQLDLLLLLNLALEAASASWEAVFWSMMQQLKCLPSADVPQCI